MNLKNESEWSDTDKAIYEEALSKAEHGRCVEISTQSAIKEMLLPGLLAFSPVLVGFVFGRNFRWLIAGVTVSGVLIIFQSNSGGAGIMQKND